jgi:hypothetical protein
VNPPQPGGGGPAFRQQLNYLAKFMNGFAFVKMKPDEEVIRSVTKGVTARAMSEPGKQYGIYLSRLVAEKNSDGKETGKHVDPTPDKPAKLALRLPPGDYRAEWVDTQSGRTRGLSVKSGEVEITSPEFREDLALRIVAKGVE